jgi:hypothetical protein
MLPLPLEESDVSRTVPATAVRRFAWGALALAVVALVAAPALASDAKTEKAAQALQKKAIEEDNLNLNYAGAIKKLQSAIGKCGPSKCSPAIKGSLLRDLGAMQVLNGNADEGKASFSQALGLDATLELDPAYKNPTIEAAWNDAKKHPAAGGGGGGGPEPVAGPQPSGDFTHTPADAALVRTPLPIYVEYPGSEDIAKVVAKYKGAGTSEWKSLELPKLDNGYGALVPCKDVTPGLMLYYVQGFNDKDEPVAGSGSKNKPFSVPVKAQIDGDPPALPGQEAPTQCADVAGAGSECPPDFPGCGGGTKAAGEDCEKNEECKSGSCVEGKCEEKKAAGDECEHDSDCNSGTCSGGKCAGKKAEGEDCSADDECDSGRCKLEKCAGGGGSKGSKVWVGLGAQLDIYILPSATDVCMLNKGPTPPPGTGPVTPNNSAGYSCVDPSTGAHFPGNSATNSAIAPTSAGAADQVQGGFKVGNLRLLGSLDFAAGQNMLIGVRAGYVLMTDPAGSAPKAAFAPVHLEGRLTYVLGKGALYKRGISPMLFVGAGAGEFDAYVPVKVYSLAGQQLSENAWLTAGPVFISAGGGLRYLMGPRTALTAALRFEGGLGGQAGFLPGLAPELGVQFGL